MFRLNQTHLRRSTRHWLLIIAGALLLSLAAMIWLNQDAEVQAKESFMNRFRNTYPGIVGTQLDSCTVCHTNIPRVNSYGDDYESHGRDFTDIESLDSDGDGYTNLQEIQALTFPGNAGSHPQPTATPTATSTSTPTPTSSPTPTFTPAPSPTPTPTPTPEPVAFDFRGVIDQITPSLWTVSGREVIVNDDTEIDEQQGPAVIGALVEVMTMAHGDGSLYASKIVVMEHDDQMLTLSLPLIWIGTAAK